MTYFVALEKEQQEQKGRWKNRSQDQSKRLEWRGRSESRVLANSEAELPPINSAAKNITTPRRPLPLFSNTFFGREKAD